MISYVDAIKTTNAYKTILKDAKANRLSHTYLFVSEDNDYLKQFAKETAKIILDLKPNSPASVQLEKEIHPDVLIYGQNEKINTALATEIASDVFVMPYESDYKIYILFLNDVLEDAQNKLLKTIEEPPKSVFFILLTNQEKKLLQTVLSRSKKIELDRLSGDLIFNMLEKAGVETKQAKICASCSNGVFSRALKLASDKDFASLYQSIFSCLYKMNSSRDVLEYASRFSNKNIDKNELADLFMIIVRDIIMVKCSNANLVNNFHKVDELKLIGEQFSLHALYKIVEYCLQLKEDLVYNTSVTSSVDEFLLKIVEVKVRCKK